MESAQPHPHPPGVLSWRLSSHPITLLTFLAFRIFPNPPHPASLLVYLFGVIFTDNMVLIFIVTILLLAADFYYLKNIAGRRLVGLRWWNEVDPSTGDSRWVFESSDPNTRVINATDSRFFWLAIYAQPVLWVALAILALVRLKFMWLPLVGACAPPFPSFIAREMNSKKLTSTHDDEIIAIALTLTLTNSLAFSRCDKFSQASNLAGSAFYSGNIASGIASNMIGRLFTFGRS
ncbi:Golgi apparatus membrane protein tvp23 [Parahypoxylon ruwenzoriense]